MRGELSRRHFLARAAGGSAGWLALGPDLSGAPKDQVAPSKPELIAHSKNPLNAEPPLCVLPDAYLTPAKYFYVRDHGPIPRLDAESHAVRVEGLVDAPGELTVSQMEKRFETIECPITLTCTGNRRSEFNWFRKPEGKPWKAGAIGNAAWRGVRLSDVLAAAGLKEGAKHVWFESLDEIPQDGGESISFGCSIPIEKALADGEEVPGTLLAWGMNGEPLPPANGFPLRVVVPGYVGGRSVKWLRRIVVSDRPSTNPYWTHSYRLFTKQTPLSLAESYPAYRNVINVAICEPAAGAVIDRGEALVRGYALPSGRREARIARVRVSADHGRSWTAARLVDQPRSFCWVRWEARVPVTKSTERLTVRAADSTGAVTPHRPNWNVKGYLYNGWHSVDVRVGNS